MSSPFRFRAAAALAAALCVAVLAACTNPAGPADPATEGAGGEAPPPATGIVVAITPPAAQPGGLVAPRDLGGVVAQASTDVYEVVAIPVVPAAPAPADGESMPALTSGDVISVTLTAAGGTAVLPAGPGDWRVVVLAGLRSGSSASLLATAATTTPVTVVDGAHTAVSLTLTHVTHRLTTPAGAETGGAFTVGLEMHTGSPHITFDLEDSSDTFRPRYRAGDDTTFREIPIAYDGTSGMWSGSVALTAPMVEGPYGVRLSGAYPVWEADGYRTPIRDVAGVAWRWLGSTEISESDTDLWPEVYREVSISPPVTGLAITVGW